MLSVFLLNHLFAANSSVSGLAVVDLCIHVQHVEPLETQQLLKLLRNEVERMSPTPSA